MKKRLFFLIAGALLIWACSPERVPEKPQSEWLERTVNFQDNYTLEQMVVLSRHNIRTPLVAEGSDLFKLTNPSFQWFQWTDPTSHLTAKGAKLEEKMGAFFREWLLKKDLLASYSANPATYRFYANAKQRCQKTARVFADAVFPGANPEVEMKVTFDTMDPVFNPQITKLPAGYADKARGEIAALIGDLNQGAATQFALLEDVLDITHSTAYLNGDFTHFIDYPSEVNFNLNAEPSMTGGLKRACTVSDALVLQYYEVLDNRKAAFGREMKLQDWEDVALVKERYGDVLFTAPSVCVNVAHPLLQTMLDELKKQDRVFSFLCGHDSNIGSVLASLKAQPYDLQNTIEKKTPIGSKVVVEKFKGKDGKDYADLWLVYASTSQIRLESTLSYQQPPVACRIRLEGLEDNADGLYLLEDVEARFSEAIAAYDTL